MSTSGPTRAADEAEFEAAIDALPPAYVDCRDLRHQYDPYTIRLEAGCYEETVRCRRCRAVTKTRLVRVADGALLQDWKTDYVDKAYLIPGVGHTGGLSKNHLRLIRCRRQMTAPTTRRAGTNLRRAG